MMILEQNLLKLNNKQFAKFSHLDEWSRRIFTFEDGKKHCLLDNEIFYTLSSNYEEPECPLNKEYQPKNIKLFDPADKDTQDAISVDDWEDYFEPVQYEDGDDKKFSNYQEAVEYVKKHIINKPYNDWNGVDEKLYNRPYQYIWSIIDSGKLILLNGRHICNVLEYIVCNTPWGFGTDSDKDVYLDVQYEE